MQQYPDAAKEIKAWVAIVKEVRWDNFPEVRGMFQNADDVKGYVIFDFRKNHYRLVTVIRYAKPMNQQRTQEHVFSMFLAKQRKLTLGAGTETTLMSEPLLTQQ